MHSWFPRWTLAAPAGDARTHTYIGGEPQGFDADLWPSCVECETPMSFLLQLAAGPHAPRIPAGHVVLVFMCESDDICDFWESDGGANAVLTLAPGDQGPIPIPDGTRQIMRAWAADWREDGEALDAETAAAFNDDRYYDLPENITQPWGFDPAFATRTGDVPLWTGNGPSDDPEPPRAFLYQQDNFVMIDAPQDAIDAAAEAVDADASEGAVIVANFLSDGIGYIFDTTPDDETPTFVFSISR